MANTGDKPFRPIPYPADKPSPQRNTKMYFQTQPGV